jgi:D-aspartate ligase
VKIFVIHARRTAYGVVRALRPYTGDIYIADTEKTPVFRSRFVKRSFLCSDITKVSEEQFLEEMIQIARELDYENEKPIVFTGKDDYLIFFSKHYSQLSPYFQLSFETDFDILLKALSKEKLAGIAKAAGVKVPLTFTQDDSFESILAGASFPLVVKPAIKNQPGLDLVAQAFRVRACQTAQEFESAITTLRGFSVPYVVQEYIPGDDSTLYTLAAYSWRGRVKAWSAGRKIRQFPPQTGECSFGMTVYDEVLLEAGTKLFAAIGLTGISQVEFKKHNGEYYLIEINPRVWSWHQIHSKDGVNLCKIACDHLAAEVPDTIHPGKESRYWMFLTMDLLHNVLLNKNISLPHLVGDVFRTDMEAFFCWSDPLPFLFHLWETIPYIRKQLNHANH